MVILFLEGGVLKNTEECIHVVEEIIFDGQINCTNETEMKDEVFD